jgi:hypothetical protein
LAPRSALENVQSLTEQLQAENTDLQNELAQEWSSAGLVGRSPIITKMLSQVELVASYGEKRPLGEVFLIKSCKVHYGEKNTLK